jgi:predicted dehydrogenase
MEEVLRLIGTGALDVESLITHRFPLEQAPEAYNTILQPGSTSLAVLLRYPSDGVAPQEVVDAYKPLQRVDIPGARNAAGSVRFALVGAGNIARWWHMPALQKASGASLRAVHSSSGARSKSYALRFKAEYCTSNFEELLNDPDIDAFLIASRNAEHASQAVAALRAGKHVFVEKPMALTVEECRQLADAVAESDRLLTVGFNRRFAPYYREMKRVVAKRPGPAVVSIRMNSPGISGGYWMADPSIGGAILGEACHFTDLMSWLLDSEPIAVSAFSLPQGKQEPIGENNVAATFHFADGSIATLTYCTVGSRTSGGERVEVFAPGIGVVLQDFKHLTIHGGMRKTSRKIWADKGYDEQLASFIQAIRAGVPPAVTVVDGIRSTIACLALMESAKTGMPQRIEPAGQFFTACASS